MTVIKGEEVEVSIVLDVARLMLVAARTAPKARGIDGIATAVIDGEDKERLAKEMLSLSKMWGTFERDSNNVRRSSAVVLVGVKGSKPKGLDCSACGFTNCAGFERVEKGVGRAFAGPNCAMFLIDLGIALGSAVKVAGVLNVDNRIMFSTGVAAKRLGLLDADVILGIPLSSAGKSIFFDRLWPPK